MRFRSLPFVLAAVAALLPMAVRAQEQTRRQVPAVRAAQPPVLDGVLDDPCWKSASTFTGFVLQELQKPLEFPTAGYLCYDDEFLYAAVRADDPEPSKIVSQETKRNGRIWADDVVEIAVDSRRQFQDYIWFALTPNGTQYEEIPGGSSANITWRGDWKGATRRDDKGWAAEFAIPWKMLRPPAGATTIGVFFGRKVARIPDWATCPNLGTRFDARYMADWVGLKIPDVAPRPVFLVYEQMAFTQRAQKPSVGVDIKHQTAAGHNWLATINPDFENIEGAVESIDFSYTERMVEDRRPFFTEGRDYFPGDELLYSRRIQDVKAAAKAYAPSLGRVGYATMATLGVHGHYNAVTGATYRFSDKPHRSIRLNGVFHHEPRMNNQAVSFGSRIEFLGKGGRTYWNASAAQTSTWGAPGDGTAFHTEVNYQANPGRFSYGVGGGRVGRLFNPMLGYFPETDYSQIGLWTHYGRRFERGLIESIGGWGGCNTRDRLNGEHFTHGFETGLWADLRPSTWVFIGGGAGYRRPYYDNGLSFGFGWSRRDIHRQGHVNVETGHTNGGRRVRFEIGQSFRPSKAIGIRVNLERSRVRYPSFRQIPDYRQSQLVLSLNYDISPERSLGGRLVMGGPNVEDLFGKNGRRNFYFSYRQAVRRGVDAFVIVGDPNAPRWRTRFAVKLLTPF